MARLTLDFPDSLFLYETHLSVRVTDLNSANHLGNDSMISLISEARARFLADYSIGETDIIITDLATVYKAEAHARDRLLFKVGMSDFNRYGGDFIFKVSRPADETLVATAKCGFVFFDYQQSRVIPMPEAFRARFPEQANCR